MQFKRSGTRMSKIEIGTLQLLRKPSTCSLSYEISGPQISGRNRKLFFLFLNQTYVVGAQKNRLDETILLCTQNTS